MAGVNNAKLTQCQANRATIKMIYMAIGRFSFTSEIDMLIFVLDFSTLNQEQTEEIYKLIRLIFESLISYESNFDSWR